MATNRSGACFSPFLSSIYTVPFCRDRLLPLYSFGCIEEDIVDPVTCAANNYVWVSVAKTQAECESSPLACFAEGYGSWLEPFRGTYTKKTDGARSTVNLHIH